MEEGWERKSAKHIFILSSSGKPIFSRCGDEQELVATFGLLQAVISIVQDQGDEIKVIKAGARRIVYFLRQSLYFIAVSSTGEPEAVLTKQLEFMYNQVLFALTNKVHHVLSQNSSKDLRDLLGYDTSRLMLSACNTDLTPTCIAFESTRGYVMDNSLRSDILSSLRDCVEMSGAALGLILNSDALVGYATNTGMDLNLQVADVLLLTHFVGNSSSLRSHDQHWVPLCLPHFNAGAFLQAYICNLRITSAATAEENKSINLSLVLISSSSDASKFKDLHSGREILERALVAPAIVPRLLATSDLQTRGLAKYLADAGCLHFLYKLRPTGSSSGPLPAQCLATPLDFPLNSTESHNKIIVQYQRLGVCLRKGTSLPECTLMPGTASTSPSAAAPASVMSLLPISDHALAYSVLECGYVVVGLATSDSELYTTFPGTITALEASGMANFLSRRLRADAQSYFQTL